MTIKSKPYVKVKGEAEWPPRFGTASIFEENRKVYERIEKPKRDINAPYIAPDEMPPTEFLGNNKRELYTSKKKLENRNRRWRDENPKLASAPPELRHSTESEIKDTAEKAYHDIKYDKIPVSEQQREIYKREEREWKNYKQRQ